MEKEYLSIKDFAAAVGVSQQAVYKQLNNKLKPYLKVVENKKMLDIAALELFKKQEKTNQVEQQLINMLQTELNKKNEQIAELQKLLSQEQQLNAMNQQKIQALEDKAAAVPEEPKKKWWKFGK